MIFGYDDWKLDTPDNHVKTVCECDYCGKDIYEGEEYIEVYCRNDCVHEECFEDYAFDTLHATRKID